MAERGLTSTADFLGLVAYLTIMYGRLPSRRMLAEAYDAAGQIDGGPGQPLLTLVPPSVDAPTQLPERKNRIDAAA